MPTIPRRVARGMVGVFSKDQIQSFIKENDIKTAGDIQNALKKPSQRR
ncbi:hypothetical protein ACL02P_19720 [Paenibacillus sp. MB22_1]|nr:hypothetical protein [Paenibacillus sp. oral taxon 786]